MADNLFIPANRMVKICYEIETEESRKLRADVAELRAELRERAEALDELARVQPLKLRDRHSFRYRWNTLDLPSTDGGDA